MPKTTSPWSKHNSPRRHNTRRTLRLLLHHHRTRSRRPPTGGRDRPLSIPLHRRQKAQPGRGENPLRRPLHPLRQHDQQRLPGRRPLQQRSQLVSTTPPRRHHRQPARKPPPIIRHPRPHQPTSKTTARPTIGSPATPPHFKNSIFQRDVAAPITIPTKTPTLAQKPSQKPPTARSPFPLPPRRPQSPSLRAQIAPQDPILHPECHQSRIAPKCGHFRQT